MIEHKDGCPSGDFGPCDCNVSLAQDLQAMTELLPCPFCGDAPKVADDGDDCTIMCQNDSCRLIVGVPATKRAVAIAHWNGRSVGSAQCAAAHDWVLMPREASRTMTMAGCDRLPSCEHVFGHAGEILASAYREMVKAGCRIPAACERQWCTACGTVSSDGKCDCNRYEDREPHFVNYADSLQADVEAMAEDLVLLRAQVESMRASLNLAYVELKKHEADYHHRTSVAANNAIVDALGQSHTSTVRQSND